MCTDIIEKFYEEANQKASKNRDKQTFMRPSKFGFKSTSDGTNDCIELIQNDPRFKKIKIIGKDLLDITLY